jgi:AcrR family transcriptional regulator
MAIAQSTAAPAIDIDNMRLVIMLRSRGTEGIPPASNDVKQLNTVHFTNTANPMGIKERQERDRETVRRSILDAARELFVSESYQNVSIRKIAERIEYSPAAIYGYFPAKDDIFFALAEEGFRLLHGEPEQFAWLADLPPLERLRAMFWRFYQFSEEHPQYFALMFIDRTVPRISREYERFAFAHEGKRVLLGQLQTCIDVGVLPATLDPHSALRVLSAGLVGVAVMRLSDRLAPGDSATDLAGDVLDLTIAGLQTGRPLRFQGAAMPCDHDQAGSSDSPRPSAS